MRKKRENKGRARRSRWYYAHHEAQKANMRDKKRMIRPAVFAAIGKAERCERCGYDRCPAAISFHHRDPAIKAFGVLSGTHTLAERIAEAAKCDVLCENCHRETHAGMTPALRVAV